MLAKTSGWQSWSSAEQDLFTMFRFVPGSGSIVQVCICPCRHALSFCGLPGASQILQDASVLCPAFEGMSG